MDARDPALEGARLRQLLDALPVAVVAHGGKLVLEETSERGSTFTLALPRGSDYG